MSFDNVFTDTNGEITFENQERLNFIMHFMKKGAVEQIKQKSDGTFIREDAELSFREIWLPCAKYQQSKIDELQKRIDEALEKCYTGIRKQGGDYYLELVEDILKGEK